MSYISMPSIGETITVSNPCGTVYKYKCVGVVEPDPKSVLKSFSITLEEIPPNVARGDKFNISVAGQNYEGTV